MTEIQDPTLRQPGAELLRPLNADYHQIGSLVLDSSRLSGVHVALSGLGVSVPTPITHGRNDQYGDYHRADPEISDLPDFECQQIGVRTEAWYSLSEMKNIIFDFDGTIGDSFTKVVEIARKIIGISEPVSDAEIERLRGMSMFAVAKELKIRPWKMPFLVAKGRRELRDQMVHIELFPGMVEALRDLSQSGKDLYILSSNSAQNIQKVLKREGIADEFIKVHGDVGLFAKARAIKQFMRQNNLDPHDTCYVGDEVRDIEAAKHAGIKIASVTWGYNNKQSIDAHEPDFVVQSPAELTPSLSDETAKAA